MDEFKQKMAALWAAHADALEAWETAEDDTTDEDTAITVREWLDEIETIINEINDEMFGGEDDE